MFLARPTSSTPATKTGDARRAEPGRLPSIHVDARDVELRDGAIHLKGQRLAADDVESLTVGGYDHRVHGMLVTSRRLIQVRTRDRLIVIDLVRLVPDRQALHAEFTRIVSGLLDAVGPSLMRRLLHALSKGRKLTFGPCTVDRDGIWVEGSWQFLGWRAKPRFVPWEDMKVWSESGVVCVGARSDARARSDIPFMTTENAIVLEQAVRFLFDGRNLEAFKRGAEMTLDGRGAPTAALADIVGRRSA